VAGTGEDPVDKAVSEASVTVRCPFCLTLNRVDFTRAGDRPKCGSCDRPVLLDRPVKVSEEDFDRTVLGSEVPVLVDFYADWCGPCKMIAPLVDEIAQDNVGKLLVAKVDSDLAPGLSVRLGIRGIPTVILFNAGAEVTRIVGFDPAGLRQSVEALV
jgi:thioredoxin 2